MSVWKNIKCPSCNKPNDRDELKSRNGECFSCGYKIVSNLNGFTKIQSISEFYFDLKIRYAANITINENAIKPE